MATAASSFRQSGAQQDFGGFEQVTSFTGPGKSRGGVKGRNAPAAAPGSQAWLQSRKTFRNTHPVESLSPYNQKGGKQGAPVLQQTVADFIAARPGCNVDAGRVEYLIQLILNRELKQEDLKAYLTLGQLAGLNDIKRPTSRKSRWANASFASETTGVRGARQNKLLPSFLWALTELNCGAIENIIQILERSADPGLDQIAPVTLDEVVENASGIAERWSQNAALVSFLQSHPQCTSPQIVAEIQVLLNTLDTMKPTGEELYSIIRALMEQDLFPKFSRSSVRVAGGALSPATEALRAKTKAGKRTKLSLLWAILDLGCANDGLLPVLSTLNAVLTEGALVPPTGGRAPGPEPLKQQVNRNSSRAGMTGYTTGQQRYGGQRRNSRNGSGYMSPTRRNSASTSNAGYGGYPAYGGYGDYAGYGGF